jgi:hypothetical protein
LDEKERYWQRKERLSTNYTNFTNYFIVFTAKVGVNENTIE